MFKCAPSYRHWPLGFATLDHLSLSIGSSEPFFIIIFQVAPAFDPLVLFDCPLKPFEFFNSQFSIGPALIIGFVFNIRLNLEDNKRSAIIFFAKFFPIKKLNEKSMNNFVF